MIGRCATRSATAPLLRLISLVTSWTLVSFICFPSVLPIVEAGERRSKIYFYHPDGLGSTAMVTDEQGNVVYQAEHVPYGAIAQQTGTYTPAHRFTGQRQDSANGLILFPARPYDPQLGRFLQPDPFVQNPSSPQTLNRYTYVLNNPTNLTDPSGNFVFAFLGALIVKALVGAVIGAIGNIALGAATGQVHNWKDVGHLAAVGAVAGGIIGGAGFVTGPTSGLVLQASTKTAISMGSFIAAGALGGGIDQTMQGGSFGRGAVFGAAVSAGLLVGGAAIGAGSAWFLSTPLGQRASDWTVGGLEAASNSVVGQQVRQLVGRLLPRAVTSGSDEAFNAIMRQVEQVDVNTQSSGTVFWSGYAQGNQAAAMKWAQATGRSTIEMTPGGRWLTSLNLYEPNSPLTPSQTSAVWRRLSQRFAQGAQGEASAFLRGTTFEPDSTFYGTELPALYGNPRVPRIKMRD